MSDKSYTSTLTVPEEGVVISPATIGLSRYSKEVYVETTGDIKVEIQNSTDNGVTWSNVSGPHSLDNDNETYTVVCDGMIRVVLGNESTETTADVVISADYNTASVAITPSSTNRRLTHITQSGSPPDRSDILFNKVTVYGGETEKTYPENLFELTDDDSNWDTDSDGRIEFWSAGYIKGIMLGSDMLKDRNSKKQKGINIYRPSHNRAKDAWLEYEPPGGIGVERAKRFRFYALAENYFGSADQRPRLKFDVRLYVEDAYGDSVHIDMEDMLVHSYSVGEDLNDEENIWQFYDLILPTVDNNNEWDENGNFNSGADPQEFVKIKSIRFIIPEADNDYDDESIQRLFIGTPHFIVDARATGSATSDPEPTYVREKIVHHPGLRTDGDCIRLATEIYTAWNNQQHEGVIPLAGDDLDYSLNPGDIVAYNDTDMAINESFLPIESIVYRPDSVMLNVGKSVGFVELVNNIKRRFDTSNQVQ